jgi:anti-sigma factor ChrR (cupin superfamily)
MVNYNDEIQELRAYRQIQRERTNKISIDLEMCFMKLASDHGEHFIPLCDLANLIIGHKYEIQKGVYFTPILYSLKKWIFLTDVDADCFFGIHEHDAVELCKVLKGNLIDKVSGKEYQAGEFARFEKGQKHKPGATVKSQYEVTFLINDNLKLTPAGRS